MSDEPSKKPLVGVIFGSKSDLRIMQSAIDTLKDLLVPHEFGIYSAHRTPDRMFEYAESAQRRGLRVIIAGAGGSAHLPGMTAAKTLVPVLAVPVESETSVINSIAALLSMVQMPAGVPTGTLAVGKAGAINAALLAAQILATTDEILYHRLYAYRVRMTESVLRDDDQLPRDPLPESKR